MSKFLDGVEGTRYDRGMTDHRTPEPQPWHPQVFPTARAESEARITEIAAFLEGGFSDLIDEAHGMTQYPDEVTDALRRVMTAHDMIEEG